ncbi:MAG: hypothetical protein ACR2OA_02350 [Rubripirellula sp.]
MADAIQNPPSVPPLSEWIIVNDTSLQNAFEQIDFLRLKHRGLTGVIAVLEKFECINQSDLNSRTDFDQKSCIWCGSDLFWALPGKTTRIEIIEFGKLTGNQQIIDDGWIHPGVYCPNGCTTRMFNFGNHDLWERMEKTRQARETSSILVESQTEPWDNYKIYLDRYIRRTAPKDEAPPLCEYIELEPGEHTIVVRDFDPHDPGRRESNTLEFIIEHREQKHFLFSLFDERLKLELVG